MNHWIIVPIVLPLLIAVALMFGHGLGVRFERTLNLIATVALTVIAAGLLMQTVDGSVSVYALGDWPAPFGIVLVLDRLSALMVLLTAFIALTSLLYAVQGADTQGRSFHALFQFQLMGLNGAFLTGDLFNLFVFFEVLLIASYGLLLFGGGAWRLRAGLHYVVLNLSGSTLFLVAVGVLYATTGTLNMADMAERVAQAGPENMALIRAGALLLLIVFALKAALLPLYFWLPEAYSAATAPVAALFAIMTKVGVYAIVRVYTLIFGADAGVAANVAVDWLLPAALLTLAVGTLGAISARSLRKLIAYLVIASIGTALTGVGLFNMAGVSAAIYYTVHSTLIAAALFLLADVIARERGPFTDRLQRAPHVLRPALLGALFFLGAIAIVGIPPLSGFIGKVLVLRAAPLTALGFTVWTVVLLTGLLMLIGLGRAGSTIFWNTTPTNPAIQTQTPLAASIPVLLLMAGIILLAVLAGPVAAFADAAAAQLFDTSGYIENVLRATKQGGMP